MILLKKGWQTPVKLPSPWTQLRSISGFCFSLFLLILSADASNAALENFQNKNWGLDANAANIKKAWKLTEGSSNVIVAVIDTGIDPNHPDLKANLWKAPTNATPQKAGSPDPHTASGSIYGWDFVNNCPNPKDYHGHGTHIAGIIGGIANSESGTAGVSQKVQIMAVKYYSENAPGSVNLANTIKALHYAINNGAKIINYSGGGPEYSEDEFQAMKEAETKGVLIVAAAGNEKHSTDENDNSYYPAAYEAKGLKNIITVASLGTNGKLLPSSNWGVKSVDIAAPGEDIASTLPDGKHGKMSGTSQATAFVSGVAALLLSERPSLTPVQLKEIIVKTAFRLTSLKGLVASGGRVDAYQALLALHPEPVIMEGRKTASKK